MFTDIYFHEKLCVIFILRKVHKNLETGSLGRCKVII